MTDPFIVYNALQTPDGTVLASYSVHDYKEHVDAVNGKTYVVDGGTCYLRRSVSEPYKDLTVYSDAPFDQIRRVFHWGTRGKDGRQPLEWKPLCELTSSHIKAIIMTQWQLPSERMELFKKELEYREIWGIYVEDK